jgi:RimJ/RimL family protein N-acetyltransferase
MNPLEVPRINAPRLELRPATLELLEAELISPARLGELLEAVVPEGWPPGEYDREAIRLFRDALAANPDLSGWYGWYALALGGERNVLVGAGGFFGPPDRDGQIEIGYSVVKEAGGQGYATEMVRALAGHAFGTGRVRQILARTTAPNIGSIRVLERSGFSLLESSADGLTYLLAFPPR